MKHKWRRTGHISYPYNPDVGYSTSPFGIYRRRKDGLYYIVEKERAGGWWCNVYVDECSVGEPWPTRAAAKVALLIRLESMGLKL